MRAVIDTNVFISGIFWTGESNKIILKWKEEKFNLIISLDMISELIKVLKNFKIKMPEEIIKEWLNLIVENAIVVEPKEKIKVVIDPKDDIIIEAAVAGNVDYIVSQDNHLLKIKEFRSIKIVTPKEFNKSI